MRSHIDIGDPRVAKALAHPLRVRILRILEQRTASPSEIADEIGAPLGNVSYHVRRLAQLGLIKLVKRTPRRGAVEHHYALKAAPAISDRTWSDVPSIVKEAVVAAAAAQIGEQVNEALAEGGFSRPDSHLSRTALVLDEAGWAEVSRVLADAYERVEQIGSESGKRLKRPGLHDGEVQASVVLMLFEQASATAQPEGDAHGGHRVGARRRRTAHSA